MTLSIFYVHIQPPDVKKATPGKDPVAGKDGGQEEETTEDEEGGWHPTQWT